MRKDVKVENNSTIMMLDDNLNISKSTWRVLEILSLENSSLSVVKMANLLKASKRMIYYDLKNIEYLFKCLEIGDLLKDHNGYYMNEEQKKVINELIKNKTTICDREDRISYIICNMICPREVIRLEALIQKFNVSRNAILRDLTQVKKILDQYQLYLKNTKKHGYYIVGDTFRKRSVFLYYLKRLLKNMNYTNLDFFDGEVIDEYAKKLKHVFHELEMVVEENDIIALSFLLLSMNSSPMIYHFNVMDMNYICQSKELKLVDEYFVELTNHERIYLTIHLLGSGSNRDFLKNNTEANLNLLDLSSELVEMFEHDSCLRFEKKEELINSIYLHLKLSYYNFSYSIPSMNPLLDDIKENYTDLFKITELCCMKLKDKFPYPFFESEITYLTMHFGSYLRSDKRDAGAANVLIVCLNGTTSSMLLKNEIENHFSNINVVSLIAPGVNKEVTYDGNIDFVITTMKIVCKYPLILVHPVLTTEDKANIVSFMAMLNINYHSDRLHFKALLDIVHHNVDYRTYQRIQTEMESYLNNGGSFLNSNDSPQVGLVSMLKQYGIKFRDEIGVHWQDAISQAAIPLLMYHCIVEEYVDKMIELIKTYGPYIIISKNIAIAHAQPKDGVKHLALSLSIYRNGLDIGRSNVKLLFVLATPNQSDHLHLLQNIAYLNEHEEVLKKLIQAADEEEALKLLRHLFKN